jgi:hypothetical protein
VTICGDTRTEGIFTVTEVAVLALCVATGAAKVVALAVVKVANELSANERFEKPGVSGLTATL